PDARRAQARDRPPGRAGHRDGHRQDSDAGRSATPGRGDREAGRRIAMKINKRVKREAKRLVRACLVHDVLADERVRRVARDVATAGRRDARAILAHFRRLVKLELARHTASVESASPLPADLRAAIESGLTRRYGSGLT